MNWFSCVILDTLPFALVFKGTDTADAITVFCTIGIVCIVSDDVLGVGVVDDFGFIPLGAAAESSTIFIFGFC